MFVPQHTRLPSKSWAGVDVRSAFTETEEGAMTMVQDLAAAWGDASLPVIPRELEPAPTQSRARIQLDKSTISAQREKEKEEIAALEKRVQIRVQGAEAALAAAEAARAANTEQLLKAQAAKKGGVPPRITPAVDLDRLDNAERAVQWLSSQIQEWAALGVGSGSGSNAHDVRNIFRDTPWPVRQGEPGYRMFYTWYMLRYKAQQALGTPIACPGSAQDFSLTPYQVSQVNAFHPRTNARRGCIFSSTGTGKTMTMAALTDVYITYPTARPRLIVWALASQGAAVELTMKLIYTMTAKHSAMVRWATEFYGGAEEVERMGKGPMGPQGVAQKFLKAWAWQNKEQAQWLVGGDHEYGGVNLRAPILIGPATDLLYSGKSSAFKDHVGPKKRWLVYDKSPYNMCLFSREQPAKTRELFEQFRKQQEAMGGAYEDEDEDEGPAPLDSEATVEEEEDVEEADQAANWWERMEKVKEWFVKNKERVVGALEKQKQGKAGASVEREGPPPVRVYKKPGDRTIPVVMLIDEVHKWSQWLSGAVSTKHMNEEEKRTLRVALALQEYHNRNRAWGSYWEQMQTGRHMQHRVRNGMSMVLRMAEGAATDLDAAAVEGGEGEGEMDGPVARFKATLDKGMAMVNAGYDVTTGASHFQDYPDDHVILGFTATPLQSSPAKDISSLLRMLYGMDIDEAGMMQAPPPGLAEGMWTFYNPTNDPVMPTVHDPVVLPCVPHPNTLSKLSEAAAKVDEWDDEKHKGGWGEYEGDRGSLLPKLQATIHGGKFVNGWITATARMNKLQANRELEPWCKRFQHHTIMPPPKTTWDRPDSSPAEKWARLPRSLQSMLSKVIHASVENRTTGARTEPLLRALQDTTSKAKRTREKGLKNFKEELDRLNVRDEEEESRDNAMQREQRAREFVRKGLMTEAQMAEEERKANMAAARNPFSVDHMRPWDWLYSHKLRQLLNVLAHDPLRAEELHASHHDTPVHAALQRQPIVRKTVVWVTAPRSSREAYIKKVAAWVQSPAHTAFWNSKGLNAPAALCAWAPGSKDKGDPAAKHRASRGIVEFNARENTFGQQHSILFADAKEYREGYDMKGVQRMIFLGSPLHYGEYLQYVGRAKRFCFHREYVEDSRKVQVYMLAAMGMPDEKLWNICMQGKAQIERYDTYMRASAIDAPLTALRPEFAGKNMNDEKGFVEAWKRAMDELGVTERRGWHAWAMASVMGTYLPPPVSLPWHTGLMLNLQGMMERRDQRLEVQRLEAEAPKLEAAIREAQREVEETAPTTGADPIIAQLKTAIMNKTMVVADMNAIVNQEDAYESMREEWERKFKFPDARVTVFA